MRNNKIYGKSNEKKFISESSPSFEGHPLGTENYSVDFSKKMGGMINYSEKTGFFMPTDLGSPDQIEFISASYVSNVYWMHRPMGLPGTRL
jgi:hypothetical protein